MRVFVRAWDGFHVRISIHLKSNFGFKNKCTITSIQLIGHSKLLVYLITGALGSILDALLLGVSKLFQKMSCGDVIPNKGINLEDAGEIPLVTIVDMAFRRLQWLIKSFNENTGDQKERYLLKGRWGLLYKKCECELCNKKYGIIAAALLHNIILEVGCRAPRVSE